MYTQAYFDTFKAYTMHGYAHCCVSLLVAAGCWHDISDRANCGQHGKERETVCDQHSMIEECDIEYITLHNNTVLPCMYM
jgi:hypothetical protein